LKAKADKNFGRERGVNEGTSRDNQKKTGVRGEKIKEEGGLG